METNDRWTETASVKRRNWLLFLLFLVGLGLRLYGYEWGFPHHFHPDERQIVDFQAPQVKLDILNPRKSVPLLLRGDWNGLNTMLSGMNTKFFAYGPLPMYTLAVVVEIQDTINEHARNLIGNQRNMSPERRAKLLEWFPRVKDGKGRIITGRIIAAILSALTILIVFRIGSYLYNAKVGYLAATLFTFTVLSIQQAHFMIVDGPQTFLVAWAMYYIVRIAMGDRRRDYYLAAILIGLAMATKFSTAPIALSYVIAHLLSITRGRRKGRDSHWHWIMGGVVAIVVMTIVMPFWILDSQEFFRDIREQRDMVTGIADLPYTIQFENTPPFVHMIRNLILWSMGLPLGLAAFVGLIAAIRRIWKKPEDLGNIVILSFVLPLFFFNGTFFAKFLRYTLVMIPFFIIFAARWMYHLKSWAGRGWSRTVTGTVIVGTILWAAAYQTIYLDPHTRLQASDWIYENIERGKHIVQESGWDDGLPVSTRTGDPGRYEIKQLGIYREPDNEQRAMQMADTLEWGDVVVLSSRKHYGSVTRVPNRYPVSSNFYKLLFDEKLGYQHVMTFDNPPALGALRFRDDRADESFRVYEHPRVDIFVKESGLTASRIQALLMAPPPEVADMTYDELMTRRPPTEIGSGVNFPILRWLIALEILGFISIPIAFVIFGRFEHKGYPFTKLVGLLIAGYICWLLPGIRWFPFSRTLIVGTLIAMAWISHTLYRLNRDSIRAMIRERWWSIAGYEILFLVVFCIFGLLKSYNPDIYWSESSMDFGFVNSILRAEYFPPEDPWIQGQGVNYYYYGHYLAAFLTKLTGVEPHYGYNLFFITIPSLVALTIAAILMALVRRVWVALIGVLFAIFIGNLDGVPQMANILARSSRGTDWFRYADFFQTAVGSVFHLGRQDAHFRFFRSAHELIKPTVHEFPYWSYNFMDLHAHTIATMLSTFFLALQFVLFRNMKNGARIFGERTVDRVCTLMMLWISYGAMISTNSWDIPTQMVFMILISLWLMVFASRQPPGKALPARLSAQVIPQETVPAAVPENSEPVKPEQSETKPSEMQTLDETLMDAPIPRTQDIGTEAQPAGASPDGDGNPDEAGPERIPEADIDGSAAEDDGDSAGSGMEKKPAQPTIMAADASGEDVIEIDSRNGHPVDTSGPTAGESSVEPGPAEEIEGAGRQDSGSVATDESAQPGENAAIDGKSTDAPIVQESQKPGHSRPKRLGLIDRMIWLAETTGREIMESSKFLWTLLWPVAVVVIGAMALHMPYLMHFHRAGMGVGLLWKYRQTTNLDGFFTMFGVFVFILITQLTLWWWTVQRDRGRSALTTMCMLIGLILALTLGWYAFLEIPLNGPDYSVLFISLYMIILILSILIQGYPSGTDAFPLLLALVATGITAGCEIVFIRDFYQGGDMRRFNTIFKFYLQAWFMFSIASAFLIARRTRIRAKPVHISGALKLLSRTSSWIWTFVFLLLLAGSLIFTVWGIHARHYHDEYRRVDLPMTLDGWAYMKKGFRKEIVNEYRAINWLQQNVKGTPVILEASGADYLYQYGDISANTGLPTVLGWWSHVDQREYLVRRNRGKNRKDREIDTGKIKRDIVTMYNSADIETVLSLLGQYRVQYIFVGPTEKSEYEELGLEKFRQMSSFMTPVYTNPDVVIYRVNDYGHGVDLSATIQDNEALMKLQQELKMREEEAMETQKKAEIERERRMMEQPPRPLLQGSQGKARGMFEEPRSLGVAPDGTVYVADFRNHRVQKYSSDGNWLAAWGETGEGPGQFNDICDVAANTRFVYVMDTFHNRIQVFTPEGKLEKILVPDTYTISHPRGIAADETGIYIADTGNSRIIRLTISGKEERIIGKIGKGRLEFSGPVGIAILGDELYVADTSNHRIQVVSKDGEYRREYPVEGWMAEVFNEPYVAVRHDGSVFYSDPTRGTVTQIDRNGKLISRYTKSSDGRTFGLPMGLTVLSNGDVLVVDARNHCVMRLKPEDSGKVTMPAPRTQGMPIAGKPADGTGGKPAVPEDDSAGAQSEVLPEMSLEPQPGVRSGVRAEDFSGSLQDNQAGHEPGIPSDIEPEVQAEEQDRDPPEDRPAIQPETVPGGAPGVQPDIRQTGNQDAPGQPEQLPAPVADEEPEVLPVPASGPA